MSDLPIVWDRFDPFKMIQNSGKAELTIKAYCHVLGQYLRTGGSLQDGHALAEYAATITPSRAGMLRAAIKCWAVGVCDELDDIVTPDTWIEVQAIKDRVMGLGRRIKSKQPKGKRMRTWLSGKQIKALLASCGDDVVGKRDRAVIALAVGAGLRRAEITGLRWENVIEQPIGEDKTRTVLSVLGKGDKWRSVPISDRLTRILDDLAAILGERTGYVVRRFGQDRRLQGPDDGLTTTSVHNVFVSRAKKAKLPTVRLHDCRRTFAEIARQNGIDLRQIQVLMGHESIKTTQGYLSAELDLETTASDFVPL